MPDAPVKYEAQVKTEAQIKAEMPSESNATTAQPTMGTHDTSMATSTPGPSRRTPIGLSKKEYEIMNGILHRLTNYRDEEYVLKHRKPLSDMS